MAEKIRVLIEADGQQYSSELSRVEKDTQQFGQTTRRTSADVAHYAGTIRNLAAAYGVFTAGRFVIQTAAQFETLNAQLITATGSQQGATAAMEELQRIARETPFALREVVNGFIRLKNLGLEPSREAIISYGNTASSMGKQLNDFVEAVADAVTGEFERLKEFGIKARTEGDNIRFIFRGQETTVRNSAAAIEGYLRELGEVEFAGAMARQMDTLTGKWSNLVDASERLAAAVSEESGSTAAMKGLAGAMTEFVESLEAVTRHESAFDMIADLAAIVNPTTGGLALFELLGKGGRIQREQDEADRRGAGALDNIGRYAPSLREPAANDPGSMLLRQGPLRAGLMTSAAEEASKAGDKLISQLEKEIALHNATSEAAKAAALIQLGALGDLSSAQRKQIMLLAEQRDAQISAEEAQEQADIRREQAKAKREALESELQAIERTASTAVELENRRHQRELEILKEAQAKKLDSIYSYEELRERLAAEHEQRLKDIAERGTRDQARSLADLEDSLGDIAFAARDAFGTMEDAIINSALNGEAAIGDMVEAIIADLARLALQQNVTRPLYDAALPLLGNLFGATLPGTPGGTGVNASPVPVAHTGGVLGADSFAMRSISEAAFAGARRYHSGGIAGDEVAMIGRRGEGVFTEAQMRALAPVNEVNQAPVTVNVMTAGNEPVETRERTGPGGQGRIVDVMVGEISRDLARNGPFARTMQNTYPNLQRSGARR